MNGKVVLLGFLALTLGCSSPAPPSKSGPSITEPSVSDAAEVIRSHERFREPIYLEIWGNSPGPTAKLLASQGLLEIEGGKLRLTAQGQSLGVQEEWFQEDVPVYQFPVGRRELVQTSTRPHAAGSDLREVEFEYRKAPNELGASLLAGGSRLDRLDSERVLKGKALVSFSDEGWEIVALEL